MRILLPFVLVLLLASCGEAEHEKAGDSLADTTAASASAFEKVNAAAVEIAVPFLVHADSVAAYEGFALDESNANKLFPPGFDYRLYKKVECIGRSKVRQISVLWYELKSTPEYDGSPDATDILMVLYDCNGEPIDVYSAATADAGYRIYSYVRNDSVFSVDISGQDDKEVLTTAIAITESGFMPAPSQSKTFHSDKTGTSEMQSYTQQYIDAHRSQR